MYSNKDYGFPVVNYLNQWQVTLFCSHGIDFIDHYVSIDSKGKTALVYVFKREDAQKLFEKFRNHELEIGTNVIKYN